ncbi:glycosyltransferase family 2 protein [Aureibacillus halotolerans]|uniref:Glycosyl transferase family 2 n=1 Tax=Aureibacillus halotolerans TaxID=1508390 RepID=A0A4R6U4I5_9BACI|nr:glycosyltransferase [Aureibacillus halotolerans]TDQ41061.1 glycosyl transferase family 2 [Aureibacillus halotolerans]
MSIDRILVASPIHQKPEILQLFLQSLGRVIDETPQELSFYFIDDNTDPQSTKLLKAFAEKWPNVRIDPSNKQDNYTKTEDTHFWSDHLVWKVAAFKNEMIDAALIQNVDGLFLVDSDLLLHPDTLRHLAEQEKDILSEVFWTQWQAGAMAQPQVWLKDEYTQWDQQRGESVPDAESMKRFGNFLETLKQPGVYEVGGLGACTFLSKHALERGVHFGEIYNLSFWGEDRHFCVRAAALGFPLYVDTHYPAFHIYRDSDIAEAKQFLGRTSPEEPRLEVMAHPRVTLSMIVRNEEQRFLKQVLHSHLPYITDAVIIDDGSTDQTAQLCQEILKDIPLTLIRNDTSQFADEISLRKQQWKETLLTKPDWILNLDADEMFEKAAATKIKHLIDQEAYDLYSFQLYDFWNETHYREDAHWNAHHLYRPFLLRYQPEFLYTWHETAQHCGRFPNNLWSLPNSLSTLRVKHLGWSREEDRLSKYERYKALDKDAHYGDSAQYESILDENPTLIAFEE